ncbi:RAQPRD family integrative conjugative element protein [Xanthobacter autotrophicus]
MGKRSVARSGILAPASRHRLAALPLVFLSLTQPATAADEGREREHLAAVVRQIDMLDRLARQSAASVGETRSRYAFDYQRLAADLGRIRAGITAYLAPPRAEPRDPAALSGDYRRDSRPEVAE